jgi:hypothetical protein
VVGPTKANPLPEPKPPGSVWKNYQSYDLLPVGTEIQITEICVFYAPVDVGREEILGAKIVAGRFAGQRIDIKGICRQVPFPSINYGNGLLVRDGAILEEEMTNTNLVGSFQR